MLCDHDLLNTPAAAPTDQMKNSRGGSHECMDQHLKRNSKIQSKDLLDQLLSQNLKRSNLIKSTELSHETKISREIKIISEVEKIWIVYDVDDNGTLDFPEIREYLEKMAFPSLSMSMEQLHQMFMAIDTDGNGCIDKQEMI